MMSVACYDDRQKTGGGQKQPMGNHCCGVTRARSGYTGCDTAIFPYPWEVVREIVQHPEYELDLVSKADGLLFPIQQSSVVSSRGCTTTTNHASSTNSHQYHQYIPATSSTLVSLLRVDHGPIHVGSQWREERWIHRHRWCGIRSSGVQTVSSLMHVVELSDNNIETKEYTVRYCISLPDAHDVDLQGGTMIKTVSIQPYPLVSTTHATDSLDNNQHNDDDDHDHDQEASRKLSSLPLEDQQQQQQQQCLVVISFAFFFDSWYGCMEEYCCQYRVQRLAQFYLDLTFQELLGTVQCRFHRHHVPQQQQQKQQQQQQHDP
jgi:hypothetical protein